ncbi:bilin-binding protein-like [Ostrinia nubilalis]|uniref:bilin-binding protein-like n=1 Tax=Ostrinia nubilalis TaxID=29057 RepID=UPI0030824E0F
MFAFFASALLAVASASVIHQGGCPEVKPIENFNVTAYQGTWYEISKFETPAEKGGKCGKAEYTVDGETVKVKNSHVINGVLAVIEGTAKFADDAKGTAKLLVTLNFGEKSQERPLNVVATDYTNYAIAYTCRSDEKKSSHQEFVWVLSRTKALEGDAKTAVDAFFASNKDIDASKLVQTDFSEEACKHEGTSTITEPNSPVKKQ